MSNVFQQYDEEFRTNAVRLSYTTSKTVKALAEEVKYELIHSHTEYPVTK